MMRVCHMTSAHPADDVRIFYKQCQSLAAGGCEVHLVAKGEIPASSDVIHHKLPTPAKQGRFRRMLVSAYTAYSIARKLKADIYHFHDPELLPYGLLLKWRGYCVIYDAHEDVPKDILSKLWISRGLRRTISVLFALFENFVSRRLDKVVAATPHIRERFVSVGVDAVDINNYPRLDELNDCVSRVSSSKAACYVGMISADRGIFEMVEALEHADIRLNLAGKFTVSGLAERVESMSGWGKVKYYGQVGRPVLKEIFSDSIAGLVIFHPEPNYLDAQPNKLFEYMSAGLPVIVSDFPLWRDIIDKYKCGICVDPLEAAAISSAIQWLIDHPDDAAAMGRRGRVAVEERFNWETQAVRLLDVYSSMVSER